MRITKDICRPRSSNCAAFVRFIKTSIFWCLATFVMVLGLIYAAVTGEEVFSDGRDTGIES